MNVVERALLEYQKFTAWRRVQQRVANRTAEREWTMEPNKDSLIKVEKYTFPVGKAIVKLGTPCALNKGEGFTGFPDTPFRAQRIVTNVPCVSMVKLSQIQVANINMIIGGQCVDAYDFNANAQDTSLDCPTITPANRAWINGYYTGHVPPGWAEGEEFEFTLTMIGPGTLVS